jgi:hypothetical protein
MEFAHTLFRAIMRLFGTAEAVPFVSRRFPSGKANVALSKGTPLFGAEGSALGQAWLPALVAELPQTVQDTSHH